MKKYISAVDYTLIDRLTVKNIDNGKRFTDTTRLDVIEKELAGTPFKYSIKKKLFHAYSQVPFEELPHKVISVSSHVVLRRATSHCFSDSSDAEFLIGTYDNSITNAAIVELMKNSVLPENLIVVFTGDEEEESRGAKQFSKFIKKLHKKAKIIVLDVTEEGYQINVPFTIENECCNKKWGNRLIEWANMQEDYWMYVPYEKGKYNRLVDCHNRVLDEAEDDEACEYENNGLRCFSFDFPVEIIDVNCEEAPKDEQMHSAMGVRGRKDSYAKYVGYLYEVIQISAKSDVLVTD